MQNYDNEVQNCSQEAEETIEEESGEVPTISPMDYLMKKLAESSLCQQSSVSSYSNYTSNYDWYIRTNRFVPWFSGSRYHYIDDRFRGRCRCRKLTKDQKRRSACERERKRMEDTNKAFDALRAKVPSSKPRGKMSKIETLRAAIKYMAHLTNLLESDSST